MLVRRSFEASECHSLLNGVDIVQTGPCDFWLGFLDLLIFRTCAVRIS